MNPLMMEMLPYVSQGYCCSQIMIQLALRTSGEDNPALVRSMWGFCLGMGQTGGTCGILTGGIAALSYHVGLSGQPVHPMALPIITDFVDWFNQLAVCARGNTCPAVTGALLGRDHNVDTPDMIACGALLAEGWGKIVELADSYGIDLTEGPALS